MSDISIRVENLSKQYRIGAKKQKDRTLREALTEGVSSSVRRIGKPAQNPDANNMIMALDDVTFNINYGEAVGIVGRNGAGKTTLLKILSRITKPTSGKAVLYGRVGSLLEVGTGFHPELTGRENIYLNGAILGMHRQEIDTKFDEIVDFSDLEKFLDTPVKRYSSGMYTRLAFAVAAHLDPEILLVDEVLAVGDLEFQKKCLGKMETVASEGRTVIYVSHNMPSTLRLCKRGIVLDKGQIKMDGPVTEAVSFYINSVLGGSGAREWSIEDAPGSSEVKLLSVSLINESGEQASVINVEEKIHLKIVYHVSTPGMSFRCFVPFKTQGVTAFAATEPTEIIREEPGVYTSILTIPANLLAEGDYIVGISIFSSRGGKVRYVLVPDAIGFEVMDPMRGSSARGDYGQKFDGVLRPKLEWELIYGGQSLPNGTNL
jgi:lipopolysaccharide transport system ATP-binding protein